MTAKVHGFEFGRIGRTKREPSMGDAVAESNQQPRPSRLAYQLAFAYRVAREIDEGIFQNRAAAARRHGITRARMTQILNLLLLPPEVQEKILVPGVDDHGFATERAARNHFPESASSTARTSP